MDNNRPLIERLDERETSKGLSVVDNSEPEFHEG